jgi:hypothetical protein
VGVRHEGEVAGGVPEEAAGKSIADCRAASLRFGAFAFNFFPIREIREIRGESTSLSGSTAPSITVCEFLHGTCAQVLWFPGPKTSPLCSIMTKMVNFAIPFNSVFLSLLRLFAANRQKCLAINNLQQKSSFSSQGQSGLVKPNRAKSRHEIAAPDKSMLYLTS